MSKLVYLVATGCLEKILPALLDKLEPSRVLIVVWNGERFKQELQPHLEQTLRAVDSLVAQAFSRFFVLHDAVRSWDANSRFEKLRAVEVAECMSLPLVRGSELEAMYQIFRVLNTDGSLLARSLNRHCVSITAAEEVKAETPFLLKSESAHSSCTDEQASASSTVPGNSEGGYGRTPSTEELVKQRVPGGTLDPGSEGTSYWLRLRGLPWEASMQDVVDFLSPAFQQCGGISTNKIHILQARQGRCSGEAYVEAPSDEVRERCVKELHGNLVGRRWIEVFKSSIVELDDAKQRCQQLAVNEVNSGGILRLRGLPWGSTEYDVMRFFQDGGFAVETCNIVVPPARGARCSGEAWVDLRSSSRAEDARRALHRQCIGTRYIEIFPSNQKEFYAAQKSAQNVVNGPYGLTPRLRAPRGPTLRRYGDTPGPYEDVSAAPTFMESDLFLQRPSVANRLAPSNLSVTTSAADVYHGSDTRSNTASLPAMTIMSLSTSAGSSSERLPVAQTSYFPTNPATSSPSSSRPFISVNNTLPSNVSYPTVRGRKFANDTDQYSFTVLRLRGLPYGSNENHIVQFFLGFSMTTILPSTVPVDGRPSGEAYVEFVSPEEALRAFQLRQGARIEHRYIELFPASKQEMEYAAAGLDPREIRLRLGY